MLDRRRKSLIVSPRHINVRSIKGSERRTSDDRFTRARCMFFFVRIEQPRASNRAITKGSFGFAPNTFACLSPEETATAERGLSAIAGRRDYSL